MNDNIVNHLNMKRRQEGKGGNKIKKNVSLRLTQRQKEINARKIGNKNKVENNVERMKSREIERIQELWQVNKENKSKGTVIDSEIAS